MIHFTDTPEKRGITEILDSPAIQHIIPDHLSGGDARNFWDDIFAGTTHDSGNEICEDEIWSEIFGRDEDEFLFDFEIDESIRTVLDKFDSAEWDTLTEEERVGIINLFVQVLADKLDLENTPEVVFFDGPHSSLGAFCPSENRVELNSALLDHPNLLRNVIPHEMRHAYQHHRADVQENWVDVLYLINFNNYISPVRLSDNTYLYYTDYRDQLVEAEARAFAKLFSGKEESL